MKHIARILVLVMMAGLLLLPGMAETQAIEVTIAVERHQNDPTQSYAEKHFAIEAEKSDRHSCELDRGYLR